MSLINRAEMFNRKANARQSMPNEVIKNLMLQKGQVVADIGSGGGYFSMRFAAEVGLDGQVYAVDINQNFLGYIKNQAEKSGLSNIKTVLVHDEVQELPEYGCDMVFIRDVYHHIANPEKYFQELRRFLKPKGKIVIIDYKKSQGFSFISVFKHYVEENEVIKAMHQAGYKHIESYQFLPVQSFNIFQVM